MNPAAVLGPIYINMLMKDVLICSHRQLSREDSVVEQYGSACLAARGGRSIFVDAGLLFYVGKYIFARREIYFCKKQRIKIRNKMSRRKLEHVIVVFKQYLSPLGLKFGAFKEL